jgi:hypothetical protein
MFQITQGKYTINCLSIGLPSIYDDYKKRAKYVDEININNSDGENMFLSITEGKDWPEIVIAQRYNPSVINGFYPGVLIIPEKELMFLGAGDTISLYDLKNKNKKWKDSVDLGFWGWSIYNQYVVMSAECEFAIFTNEGHKLWTTFVEPPWDFKIEFDIVELDIMGNKKHYNISDGKVT